ncbi:D-alanyl-lipoteichoic acid acyltransferase DltB (MBOAT superfamily) [Gelidibacter algens]|jgi:D-alanyl-lipoteichoic acid acyltransferase DltB (MBOAT superfamily)|uniref:D-alanyl-lipoteichoic acid acyltransferase DltB (MBOAT superfamily) n=1 Tax=Gelidibacter algens TaxID=49280 RepID=A0A1A7QWW9_9FLAO|nr:MBOAT family O-acyltransferase [Gelidibacter algens]OBX23778.1 acyltransferase [Gelidibacter algens]RAJ27458.1 D-alanyl-lipoteichoic acid acyltransferase DltB (MBOAT superfamily) [Gelidibacter algens]
MLFNSIDFAIFLPVVFILYWFFCQKNLKLQNLLIVAASYLFYGWWDWRFLSLIVFSTIVDYSIGVALSNEDNQKKRKLYLWISIIVNLGFLGFFKYYNFFLDNLITAFTFFGTELRASSLKIILPVGISFYTFQTLSYTIDVYRKKITPTKDIVAFSAFVSFFPQLVAGPIERATNLLPQFYTKRKFEHNQAVDGLRQILWGMFKKIVIADNCAEFANEFFNNHTEYGGSGLLLGAIFFTFQIYGDFSGYSDIAIGTSRLFGFNLKQNFAFPYFSRDIAEFWRRWHISLSTWFRDYLYIPLGGSKGGTLMKVRNTFIIFIVSGFWHGANWTFIVWGALNAIYFLPLLLAKKNRANIGDVAEGRLIPSLKEILNIISTFLLTVLAWVFFRADSVTQAIEYLIGIFSKSLFSIPEFENRTHAMEVLVLIGFLMFIEWLGRESQYGLEHLGLNWNRSLRIAFYLAIICLIFLFMGKEQEFIYFQF